MLGQRLTEAEKAAILDLLAIPAGLKITPFQQLQQTATRPSPEALTRELDHLEQVRALLPETLDLSDLPEPLIERWARLTGGLPTRSLQRYAEEKRMALLLCWLWRLRTQLIDTALTVGNELVAGVLRRAHPNYVRPETLRRATARLVNFHLRQWLPAAWGQGFTSSSDAALYHVPVRALNATFHPKYFASAGRGVAVYTHVSDLWIPFYTQVITCHVRQAPFILDGLLRHGTLLNPREHYTDTHGYTDLNFGVTHLLGIRFAPRIKDLPDQRLWRLPDSAPYQHIEEAVSNKLNVNLICDTWDEMLRLAASLKCKVFFGSLGEVRDRTYEDQLNAASSLNLLLAAIVCWNTVHLQACIKKLRADGFEAKEEDLRFLSPLLRHHIGIYGQYSFDFRRYDEIPSPEELSY